MISVFSQEKIYISGTLECGGLRKGIIMKMVKQLSFDTAVLARTIVHPRRKINSIQFMFSLWKFVGEVKMVTVQKFSKKGFKH